MENIKIKAKYYIYGFILSELVLIILKTYYLYYSIENRGNTLFSACLWGLVFFYFLHWFPKRWYSFYQKKNYVYIFVCGFITSLFFQQHITVDFLYTQMTERFIFFLGYIVPGSIIIYMILFGYKEKMDKLNPNTGFLSNSPIHMRNEDKFFMSTIRRVKQTIQEMPDSSVIGIEGKWGIGKTSLVNLCCQVLKEENSDYIVYKFNPLKISDTHNLLESFYKGLIATIKENHFEPEIESLLDSYIGIFLNTISEQSVHGVKFKLFRKKDDEEIIYLRLNSYLSQAKFKIIIVIDDLDRLDFKTIKQVFYLMRNIFRFNNMKFIICYDMDNIVWSAKLYYGIYGDNMDAYELERRIIVFTEKYIDIIEKVFNNSSLLENFITDTERAVLKNKNIDIVLWNYFVGRIKEIYHTSQFMKYEEFLGTPRNIKRIFNALINICSNQNCLDSYDFYPRDLVDLLLLFLWYPSIFKDIFYAETNGRNGVFSWNITYENTPNNSKKFPSSEYEVYIKNKHENAKFLLNQLFYDKGGLPFPERFRAACFNTSSYVSIEGNLEKYLKIIVDAEKPIRDEQYSQYLMAIDDILKEEHITKKTIDNILRNKHMMTDESRMKLFQVLIHSEKINFKNKGILKEIIFSLVDSLKDYKLTSDKVPFLNSKHLNILVYISILINKIPDISNNPIEVLKDKEKDYLARYILDDSGIINRLENQTEVSNIIKFIDVLYIRGCFDIDVKGSNLFNIAISLIYRHDRQIQVQSMNVADMAKISLEDISKRIYQYFIDNFFETNIFDIFNNLSLNELTDKKQQYNDVQSRCLLKSIIFELKLFVFYQIGSSYHGMGDYSVVGNEPIKHSFAKYLIEKCFAEGEDRYLNFIEFIFISFFVNRPLNIDDIQQVKPQQLCTIMPKEILIQYLVNHYDALRSNWYQDKIIYINQNSINLSKFMPVVLLCLKNLRDESKSVIERDIDEMLKN